MQSRGGPLLTGAAVSAPLSMPNPGMATQLSKGPMTDGREPADLPRDTDTDPKPEGIKNGRAQHDSSSCTSQRQGLEEVELHWDRHSHSPMAGRLDQMIFKGLFQPNPIL